MTKDTSTEQMQAADGTHTERGRPRVFSSLTPFVAVRDARAAIRFYEEVLGARLVDVTEMGGTVAHAELDLPSGRLQLGEPMSDFHLVDQPGGDDASFSIAVYVEDVDAAVARAEAAGATVREPATTFVSGDRFASIRDPFGVRWSVMTRVEDLSPEQSAERVARWAAEQGMGHGTD